MSSLETFIIKIDQLPEETIEAGSPDEAVRMVEAIIRDRDGLQRLHDDEPVQIKTGARVAWGRNLTVGAFRKGTVTDGSHGKDGPLHPPSVEHH